MAYNNFFRKCCNINTFHHCYVSAHVDNEMYFSRALERLGGNALSKDQEPDIGAAFLKFAVVTKELSALMKTLVSSFIYILIKNLNDSKFSSVNYLL